MARKNQFNVPRYKAVTKAADVPRALEALARAKYMVLDTETDGIRGDLVVWSFSTGPDRWVIDAELLHAFQKPIQDKKLPKIMHNAKYDLTVFEKAGLPLKGFKYDPMVMTWLADENRFNFGLKYVVRDEFGYPMKDFDEVFGYKGPRNKKMLENLRDVRRDNPEKLFEYASLDPFATYEVFKLMKERLREDGLLDYYLKVELPFTEVIRQMELRGVQLDLPVLEELQEVVGRTAMRYLKLFGVEAGEDVNINSPKQIAQLLYEELGWPVRKRTATGQPSTDAEVIEYFAEAEDRLLAVYMQQIRRAEKMQGGFVLPLQELMRLGRIHTSLNQTGTRTGRLSSSGPNLQNIPARKEKDPWRIRRAFVATPGYELGVLDYGGIELRLLAHMSRDKLLLEAFGPGGHDDPHSMSAKLIPKFAKKLGKLSLKEIKEKYPDERTKGKTANFAMVYGAGPDKIGKIIGGTVDDGKAFLSAFMRTYKGVERYMQQTVQFAEKNGYVLTLGGRRRRAEDALWLDPDKAKDQEERRERWIKRGHAQRQIQNSPIQGGAADVIKMAMLAIHHDEEFNHLGGHLLLQVHDELMIEAPKKNIKRCFEIANEKMTEVFKDDLVVVLKTDGKIGPSWEAAK